MWQWQSGAKAGKGIGVVEEVRGSKGGGGNHVRGGSSKSGAKPNATAQEDKVWLSVVAGSTRGGRCIQKSRAMQYSRLTMVQAHAVAYSSTACRLTTCQSTQAFPKKPAKVGRPAMLRAEYMLVGVVRHAVGFQSTAKREPSRSEQFRAAGHGRRSQC